MTCFDAAVRAAVAMAATKEAAFQAAPAAPAAATTVNAVAGMSRAASSGQRYAARIGLTNLVSLIVIDEVDNLIQSKTGVITSTTECVVEDVREIDVITWVVVDISTFRDKYIIKGIAVQIKIGKVIIGRQIAIKVYIYVDVDIDFSAVLVDVEIAVGIKIAV
ncbi:hypothetical protein CU102_02525 [Phyllobacterium brassicacearum]|uniref:Uncharacterized protein n=1 Tax=Phyllobacterium brassicacearum TaxID=314235 RepID=A0A2P7BWV0_9HYPH|nr:hypothetical protein CU102_02525 [Phyllobacterium brassicacearum]